MQAAKKIMVAKLRKEEKININKLAYLYEVIFLVNKVSLGWKLGYPSTWHLFKKLLLFFKILDLIVKIISVFNLTY